MVGTAKDPIVFDGKEIFFQNLSLVKGWNWISFNLSNSNLPNVSAMLMNGSWTTSDVVKSRDYFDSYSRTKGWTGSLTKNGGFDNVSLFMLHSSDDQILSTDGAMIDPKTMPITVLGGRWNYIGYLLNNGKKEKFDLAPYVGGYQGMGMNMAYLLFDRKTQSFVTCNWSNPTSNEAECQKLTESWASTGREILYMQSVGWTGRVYALLKDQSGKVWQYTFTVTGPVVMLDPVAGIQELNAPNLANATCFSYNQFLQDFCIMLWGIKCILITMEKKY